MCWTHRPLSSAAVILYALVLRSEGHFVLPPLNDKLYIEEGDLDIGGLFSVTEWDAVLPCSDIVNDFFRIDLVESLVFSIRDINQKLFPNIKLGFVIADACNKETTAALQALRFLPESDESDDHSPEDSIRNMYNGTPFLTFDVIGVIGTDASFTTIPAAMVLSTARIPMISSRSTSDTLSDEVLFPNFFRAVAPDKIMMQTMVEFIRDKQWYYFSTMYDNDYQFLSLREQVQSTFAEGQVCFDHYLKVNVNTNFTEVLSHLIQGDFSSKFIVVLTSDYISKLVIQEVYRLNLNRKLFWFGADTWMQLIFDERAPNGSVGVSYTGSTNPLQNYMEHLMGLYGTTKNPWLSSALQHFDINNENSYRKMVTFRYHENPSITTLTYNGVYALIKALKDFLKVHNCSLDNGKEVARCFRVHSMEFADFFRKTSLYNHPSGSRWITESEIDVGYSFYQLVLQKNKKLLDLCQYSLKEQVLKHINDMDFRSFDFNPDMLFPERFCMPQCEANQYRFYVTRCCWKCKVCQDSEIVSDLGTHCEHCPLLYWPALDEGNKTYCLEIEPDYYTLLHPMSAFLFLLSLISALCVVAVFVWYVVNKDSNLVKASSAELNYVHLCTFLMSYLSVPLLLKEPTFLECNIGVLLFTSSFNISYMIMLTKAIRVYRIFTKSVKSMKVAYISPRFHMAVCTGFFSVELIRFMITSYFFPIKSTLNQPEFNVKYVEKVCSVPAIHILLFIALDFILLLLCSLFAFKTQTLPSRFKESRFVSLCVLTTLISWSAFLPAYFTTLYHKTRSLYIVFAILINNNMALSLVFVSRLLLVEYIKGDGWLFSIVNYLCFCEKN